jgi:DNA repair exonuclease SbcCD ATPase subunit
VEELAPEVEREIEASAKRLAYAIQGPSTSSEDVDDCIAALRAQRLAGRAEIQARLDIVSRRAHHLDMEISRLRAQVQTEPRHPK